MINPCRATGSKAFHNHSTCRDLFMENEPQIYRIKKNIGNNKTSMVSVIAYNIIDLSEIIILVAILSAGVKM